MELTKYWVEFHITELLNFYRRIVLSVLANSEVSLPFFDFKKPLKFGTKEETYLIPVSCLKKQQDLFTKITSFPR